MVCKLNHLVGIAYTEAEFLAKNIKKTTDFPILLLPHFHCSMFFPKLSLLLLRTKILPVGRKENKLATQNYKSKTLAGALPNPLRYLSLFRT
jgi:hypothetical protein